VKIVTKISNKDNDKKKRSENSIEKAAGTA